MACVCVTGSSCKSGSTSTSTSTSTGATLKGTISCAPVITKYQLNDDKIAELISGSSGVISLSTTPYSNELSSLEKQYWKYHSPWGNPGDQLHILEDYRIDKVCQDAEGYTITIKYRDGSTVSHSSRSPMAITAKDKFISASGAVPDEAIRLKLIIQDIQVSGDNWEFTVARIVDEEDDMMG